jgi:hypothetical protein
MTEQQFAVIAKLLRSGNSASSRAARLVLLDDVAPSVAADQCGISRSSCSDAVGRYREAAALINSAWK